MTETVLLIETPVSRSKGAIELIKRGALLVPAEPVAPVNPVEPVNPVAPVAPVAPAAPSEDMANVLAQVTGFSSQLEKFASKEEMISKFEAQENEIKELKLKVSEFVHLFVSVLELPSAAPIEQPRNKFDKTNKIINKLQKIN